jgi:hypothetical protein
MIIRLRLFLERLGWKPLFVGVLAVAALVAAGVVFAVTRGGGGKGASESTASTRRETTNLYYLRALAPKVRASGCAMYIRFVWKPDFHADQYIDATAVIRATGSGIDGTYRKRFTAKGVSLDVGPLPLGGGYRLWSARVEAIDGDPPGNETTIQAAPPQTTKCD